MKLIQTLTPAQIVIVYHIINSSKRLEDYDELYEKLFNFYAEEMPYGTQKAKDGDPFNWITNRLGQDMPKQISYNEANILIQKALEENRINPEYRYGQALFNLLYESYPELADAIRSTDVDPFYNDRKSISFIETIIIA